jgi:dihydroflavonol-4-reductase
MRIGITGGNGFIGNHLLRSAIANGHRPVVFLQRGSPLAPIQDLEGQYDAVEGDLLDARSHEGFVAQVDHLYHLAGFNRYWTKDPRTFHQVNVEGVRAIAEACLAHGVKKLVHASSCITRGASDAPTLRDEDSGYNLGHLPFLYGETKTAGEEEMKRYAKERGLPVVIINPTSAVGECDWGPTPIGKPIADIARGMWPVYVAGGACFIDVHDVVRALWLALEKAEPGSQYLLVGENLTNQAFMTMVAECAGVRPPRLKVPKPLLSVVARASEAWANNVSHAHPSLTVGMNGLIGKYLFFSGERAARDLGFTAGPVRPAIERCIRWFREQA